MLYAGKRSLGKGTPVLVAALEKIRAAVPGVRFAFAGKGDVAPPAAPDVHVLGSVPQATLFALYRAAAVVVVPSIWPEPLSRVLLEAMRFGRGRRTAVGGSAESWTMCHRVLFRPRRGRPRQRGGDPCAIPTAAVWARRRRGAPR